MRQFEVIFISFPGNLGNLVPTVQFARHLTNRDPRFSATILMIDICERPLVNAYIHSCAASSPHINFHHLPPVDPPSPDQYQSSLGYFCLLVEKHRPHVKQVITKLLNSTELESESNSVRVAALFVDMFCTSMIDVARELGVPCYLFFASPASFLRFMLHLPTLEAQLATDYTLDPKTELLVPKDPAAVLTIPGFTNALPPSVLPTRVLKKKNDGYFWFLHHAGRYTETDGLVVNTFRELEQHAVDSLCNGEFPPVYPIGPIVDLAGPAQWHPDRAGHESIINWLDGQTPSSVVFLCFGSLGSLSVDQLREIATGLNRAQIRFIWSIREPPKETLDLPGEYKSLQEILPDGLVDELEGIGKICGWVPQSKILGHEAVGGFVSHCGWNSVLESLWFGVRIAAWPLYAEQQMNAFQLVKELKMAVEIRLEYREGSDLVLAEEFERGLKRLMKGDDEVRKNIKQTREKSRMAISENGSSYRSLGLLIDKLAVNT